MIVNPTTFKSGGEKNEYQVELSGDNFAVTIDETKYTSAQTITVPAGTWCDIKRFKVNTQNATISFNGKVPMFESEKSPMGDGYILHYKFPVFRDCKIVIKKPSGFVNHVFIDITTS